MSRKGDLAMTQTDYTLLFGLMAATAAAIGCYCCALRKGRPAGSWAEWGFLVAPSMLVLELLPARPSEPHTQPPTTFHAIMEAVGVLAVLTFLGWCGYGLMNGGLDALANGGGIPACTSALAQDDVNSAIAGSPMGKLSGLSVVSFQDIVTQDSSPVLVDCGANVTLNSGVTSPASFSFRQQNGQTLVLFRLAPQP
jgi:hypothetical protein